MLKRENDRVVIDLSEDDFAYLLFAIGLAAGGSDPKTLRGLLDLANRINEGNPQWTPYG